MNKIFIILLFCLFILIACDAPGQKPITNKEDMRITCIDGVQYFYFRETEPYHGYGYMSPKFNRDGTISTCNSERN